MAIDSFKRFVFVRSLGAGNASIRIHMNAVEEAIRRSGRAEVIVLTPGAPPPDMAADSCLLFYYADGWAIDEIRRLGLSDKAALSLCFGSDIKTYSQYQDISDITDCFLMPSADHAAVLALGVMTMTAVVREGVDPVYLGRDAAAGAMKSGSGRKVIWFGYAESFLRGMDPILGVIQDSLRSGRIERFATVLNRRTLDPRVPALDVIEYSAASMLDEIAGFDYAILSHIPADLHLNSFIKSPNKVIAALVAGLVPLVSDTPNYRATMTALGLEHFLFRSPFDLHQMLQQLDIARDRAVIERADVFAKLQAHHSAENILADLATAIDAALTEPARARQVVRDRIGPWREKSFVGFGDHARNILPSAIRAVKMRLAAR